ncbi:hypothetical protein GCM10007052_21220 [Halioglobus japonicus]|nr:hypothetical protein GCM10007052_21220 [Halioglobus japonicus]
MKVKFLFQREGRVGAVPDQVGGADTGAGQAIFRGKAHIGHRLQRNRQGLDVVAGIALVRHRCDAGGLFWGYEAQNTMNWPLFISFNRQVRVLERVLRAAAVIVLKCITTADIRVALQ